MVQHWGKILSTLGNFTLVALTLGYLFQCSPTVGYNTMGNPKELFYAGLSFTIQSENWGATLWVIGLCGFTLGNFTLNNLPQCQAQTKWLVGACHTPKFSLNFLCLNYKLTLDLVSQRTTIMVDFTSGTLSLWLVTLTPQSSSVSDRKHPLSHP